MKFIKLGILSIIVFSFILWAFSLLFPASTVLSRVRNLPGSSTQLQAQLQQKGMRLEQWLLPDGSGNLSVATGDAPFYKWQLYNGLPQPEADTLYFQIKEAEDKVLNGGIGFYQLTPDSVTTQIFLVFETPWYNPVKKLGMMLVDKQYGPIMEGALQRLYDSYLEQKERHVFELEN